MWRKSILIILIVVIAIGVYLNRSYAHFFNYITDHFQTNPTINYNYEIGIGPPIKYVALGDSLTAGTGTNEPTDSFPYQLSQKIAADGHRVELMNLGIPGGKADNIISGQIEKTIAFKPNLITILIGVNDLQDKIKKTMFAQNLDKIIVELKAKTTARIIVASIPHLGAYPALLWPHYQYFNYQTQKFNTVIQNIATANSVEFIDLYSYNKNLEKTGDNFYSPDYFHPNKNGYRAWAEFFYANYRK